ncbi:MAG: ABC transporter substrate-binding protein [Dehalococcoidia bacterium]|nr:ABC transporter substrate-binding protein [Dehalococcoidia bacterium]
MTARHTRRQFLARAGMLGVGIAGAALVGCTSDEGGADGGPEAVPGSRLRVRSPLPRTERPTTAGALHLGVLASQVGADGLDPTSRLAVYSRLVGVDPRTASVYGDLAREVELPEPLTVRIGLRAGAYFHPDSSGTALPLTAGVIAADFRRRASEAVFVFSDVIEEIEAPSETELVLRLRAPFSLLFEFLAREDASIRGEGSYGAVAAPMGSGAFMPQRVDGGTLVMRPNPLLEDKDVRPRLSGLTVHRAERPGDLDVGFADGVVHVYHHLGEAGRQAARAVPGRVEATRAHQRMRGLALSQLPPRDQASEEAVRAFRDARVRRALSLALDREALTVLDGGLLCGPVGPAFGGDALPRVELQSHPLYQHNQQGARELLRAAGYEDLPIRIAHADTPMLLSMAQTVVDQLGAAGFQPRLVTRPQPEFQAAFLAGDFEAAFFELDRLNTPDIGLRLHTSGGLDGTRSPWGYSDPIYDAAVRDALSQVDPVLRTRRAREAQRLLLDSIPAMFPLTAPSEYASLAEGVRGYEFDAFDFNAGILASQWEGPATPSVAAPGANLR